MMKAKELIKFLEILNEDTKVCVSLEDVAYGNRVEAVGVHFNAEDNELIIIGEV